MHKNVFWKKGLVVGIIFLFLGITIAPSINATESRNINIKSKNNGEVDLVGSVEAWWSPAPWDNGDILGYFLTIENIGDSYHGEDIWINYSVYFIYPVHEEVYKENRLIYSNTYIEVGVIKKMYGTPIINEKPEKIRFEIETNAPESNKQNNVISVQISYGVTFYGMIYRKVLGDKYPVLGGIVSCNSDILPLFEIGSGIYRDGSYIISVPKNANEPPFSYTLQVSLGLGTLPRIKVIETPPLDEFEYAEIDFIFGLKGKSVNLISFDTVFRFFNGFPLLQRILNQYLIK